MLLEVRHCTTYSYDAPVYIEPQLLRLKPHSNGRQQVKSFALDIEPQPSGQSVNTDLDGNETVSCWFEAATERYSVDARSVVDTSVDNPFGFLITAPESASLPAKYPAEMASALRPYRLRAADSAEVNDWTAQFASDAGGDTLSFLSRLCATLYSSFTQDVRWHGEPWSPKRTLAEERGACRDLAVLFMDACRSQGLAARFVSGYNASDPRQQRHLHAWAEVYLPGGGWRGFDPTSGLAVGEEHVSVAWAAESSLTTPILGSFRGTGVTAKMDARISIQVL